MTRKLSSLQRGLSLLEAFDADHPEWGVRQLSARTGLPASSVHLMLTSLAEAGMLRRTAQGRYTLGWRLLSVSSALYSAAPWYRLAHEAMEALSRETGELTFLSLLEEARVMCVARSRRPSGAARGETAFFLPPERTASGRLLLALATPQGPGGREPQVPPELRQELWRVQREGYAETDREWRADECALAAPLRDLDGQVVAALGVAVHAERYAASRSLLLRRLLDRASRVSFELGYRLT
ncbi:DNA-binding IclR family transcriptional regulator [Deinobacterium chartae]|uniref:DNA-binding IclR family transcriptional regulator n=1 Tax=Deinobacterium chartae TaxID=521158 RepID=A0A841I1W0_9DEIO|nr:IclR family transcriptional regulator [Deinobacterium chartae]MBB6098308.1 DNA-binding IclR family transcriptional regulator [Deinobacterium chartae]